jgi:cytoskeletal protein RodZ
MKNFSKLGSSRQILIIFLCVMGIAAVTLWSALAGPLQNSQTTGSSTQSGNTPISAPSYSSAGQINNTGLNTSANGTNTSSSTTSSPTLQPPVNDTPAPPVCKAYGGVQPDVIYCPINCETATYPVQTCCPPGNRFEDAQIHCWSVE